MKLTHSIIKAKAQAAKQHPKFLEKSDSVRSISGIDILAAEDISDSEIVFNQQLHDKNPVILLTPNDLLGNGTACGSSGNKCFTKEVVDFLKKSKVTEIFTSVMGEDDGSYYILGCEMNITQKNAKKLSRLVDKHEGSWRDDVGTERGWSSFETE